jgi:hypothetical protein
MLQRFFAKKNHPYLQKIIPQFVQQLDFNPQHWTFKQQAASYQQPYRYVAQGQGWTVSFYEPALKEKQRTAQTELVLVCRNESWFTLLAQKPGQPAAHKRRLDIAPLPNHTGWSSWQWHSNNESLAETVLAVLRPYQNLFRELEAVELVLERQRLYVRWTWLPTTAAQQQQLYQTMQFAQSLTQAVDQVAATAP